MHQQKTFSVGLNALPAYISVSASTSFSPLSYARALLKQDVIDNQSKYDNFLPLRSSTFIEGFSPLSEKLSIVDAEEALANLHIDISEKLRNQHDQLIQRYRAELPLLEGETLSSLKLGILKQNCQFAPSGTLVAIRSTNLAEAQFIIPWIRVDRKHGIPVFKGPNVEDADNSERNATSHTDLPAALNSQQLLTITDFWGDISSIGSCVIWVAPPPWNAVGAGLITALRLLFTNDSGTAQTLVNTIYESVKTLLGEERLNRDTAAFLNYRDKLTEIKGDIDTLCRNKPLYNELISDKGWLGDGFGGLRYQYTELNKATNIVFQNTSLFDQNETLGYHSAYIMGIMFQVQAKELIAKIQAQFASNIGNCNPPNLDIEKLSPAQSVIVQEPTKFLDETRKFYEDYVEFKNLCVGYYDSDNKLQPGKYQEVSKYAHDIWYKKYKSISAIFAYQKSNMYNETWWRYYTWVDVSAKTDDGLSVSDDDKKKVEALYTKLKDKDDAGFWNGLIEYQHGNDKLDWKPLVYLCQYTKSQREYMPEHWPIFSELTDILKNIDWENADNYYQSNKNPLTKAEWWLKQVTQPKFGDHVWWKGPANVDDDKKTPLPLCREAAAEILELFLIKQIRTHITQYGDDDLSKNHIESDRHIHNICCTDQYEVTFTDHPDQALKDRDDKLSTYLANFNLSNMISTARQIHDSIYSTSSLMCPMPPEIAPSLQTHGKKPGSSFWLEGNTVEYVYSFRNSAGPSPSSPTGKLLIPKESTGVLLTLESDPFEQATQFLVFRNIKNPNGQLLEEKCLGGGKIKAGQQNKLIFNDFQS